MSHRTIYRWDKNFHDSTCRYTRIDVTLEIKTTQLQDLQRGEAVVMQHNNLVANVWREKRLVYVMSTNTSHTMDTCNRKDKDGTNTLVSILKSTQQLYERSWQSWPITVILYIFNFLLETSIDNSFVLQKTTPFKALKPYRLALAERLIGDYNSRQRYGYHKMFRIWR